MTATRPHSSEDFAPYYDRYVSKVADGDIVEILRTTGAEFERQLRELPESKGGHRYAEGKWSIREVAQHVIDAERIFTYRALRVARGDATPLPSFDENAYAAESHADRRTLADLADEFAHVRAATVSLFGTMDPAVMTRKGIASGNQVSVRGIAWIVAGHAVHHLSLLRERYL